ncbi:MAG: hypothetical protein QM638_06210, partial [Nocardioides sp.]|uniref:hypothetical protein n=1 Tax=Nocardioides sp. TaxID=35761 RepID=UPI0039E355B8
MTETAYTPGTWLGIVGDNACVLLPPAEKKRAAALWALIDDGAGFDEVLDALLADGLRNLPAFVLIAESDGVTRAVVRGGVVARFTTPEATVDVDGASAATWAEQSLADVTALQISVGEEPTGPATALRRGLVRVSGLLSQTGSAGAVTPAGAAAPA